MRENEEVSALDAVVFVAEYWIWIIILPLLVGGAALIVTNYLPHNYEIRTRLDVPERQVVEYLSATNGYDIEAASVEPSTNGRESELVITRSTASEAQAIHASLLTKLRAAAEEGALVPNYVVLQERIDMLESFLSDRQHHIGEIRQTISAIQRDPAKDVLQYTMAMSMLSDMFVGWREEIQLLSELREKMPQDRLLALSTQGPIRVGRSPYVWAGVATLCTAALALAAILFMKIVGTTMKSNEEKFVRIRKGLLLRR